MSLTVDELRRFAVARSLFRPTTLKRALGRLGFVQADPIRSPARAQDLTLRHRVAGYRAGDLERRYAQMEVEEDAFINYGFVTRPVHELMHPRASMRVWPPGQRKRVDAILAFVRERGAAHPRHVDDEFSHGTVTNYWGGSSNATTHLLELMHYRGLLRVERRDAGIRVYAVRNAATSLANKAERAAHIDALVDIVVNIYGPLPSRTLSYVVARLQYAVPQWRAELPTALQRARARLSRARLEGIDWYWSGGESPRAASVEDSVRFLAPFDPVVWDRRRFELFWGWRYRFEAYTPLKKRAFGYYALPLLWRDQVVGWGNIAVRNGALETDVGFTAGHPPRERRFRAALDEEVERLRRFLRLSGKS